MENQKINFEKISNLKILSRQTRQPQATLHEPRRPLPVPRRPQVTPETSAHYSANSVNPTTSRDLRKTLTTSRSLLRIPATSASPATSDKFRGEHLQPHTNHGITQTSATSANPTANLTTNKSTPNLPGES